MTRDNGRINPENKRLVANDIYSTLQSQRGITSLSTPNSGEVIHQDLKVRVRVVWQNVDKENRDYNRMLLGGMGFTDPDIDQGILLLTETQFRNPNWPIDTFFRPEKPLLSLRISGNGKAIKRTEEGFEPTEVDVHHLDALQRMAKLSVIPGQIVQAFGSYEEFVEALGARDMAGIDSPEEKPYRALYNGGLSEFVKAHEMREDFDLEGESVAARDRFTNLWRVLSLSS